MRPVLLPESATDSTPAGSPEGLRLPRALQPGDVIGVVAPASAFPREGFELGVRWLESQGYRVRYLPEIFERHHYYAGSFERRVAELERMLLDPEVRAIVSARGGYGSTPVAARVDWSLLQQEPRILVGCSDLTPLLNQVARTQQTVTFHGPMVAGFHKTQSSSLERLIAMLTQPGQVPAPMVANTPVTLRAGTVTAPVCGGNLCMIAATLGTSLEVDTRGRILCLEEIGERPYRLDRMLTQLQLAGKLKDVAGIAIGGLIDCEEPGGRGRPPLDVVAQVIDGLSVPVVAGLPFGHGPDNDPVALGATATLDASQGSLSFLYPVVC